MKSEALDRLYKKYYNEAKLYVFSMCRSQALTEDIVAEAFCRAFETIDEERDNFKYWLLKVCRNCYFDHLRKAKRNSELSDNLAGDTEALADTIIRQDEYKALYKAISVLQDNYKEVILLYYFDGLSVSEIAGVTEQTVDNVKVQMYRARIKLKHILEERQ